MDNNPGSAQNSQPSQDGQFGPPQSQPPYQPPAPPQSPVGGQPQPPVGPYDPSTLAIKPAWQVEVMQKMWQQQGDRGQTVTTPYQPQGAGPQLQTPSWQQPYGAGAPMQPQTPTFSMTAPQVGQPGNGPQMPLAPAPPPPPYQPPVSPTAPMPDPYASSSGSKKWLVVIILLILVVIGGGIALYMLVRAGQSNDPQKTLSTAFTQALKTQTYNETMVVQENGKNTTYSRIADFRKVGEPHVYMDNIAPPSEKSVVQVTVYGNDYYARKHFSDEDIAKADNTAKAYIAKLQDKWVQVIDDDKPTQDRAITDYINVSAIRRQRVTVPSVVIMGYFRENEQQELANFVSQNNIYTTPLTPPAEERLDDQTVQKFAVAVNAAKVAELNAKAATAVGQNDEQTLQSFAKAVPDQLEVWVRKSDQRIIKYSYKKDNATYTYSYDKIDEAQEVSRPRPEGAAPEGANASDDETKEAASTLYQALNEYRSQGNSLPGDAASFGEFVTQKVDTKASNRFSMQFKDGKPERGYIFYQLGKKCNQAQDGFEPADPGTQFALLTKLAGSLYCVDNID